MRCADLLTLIREAERWLLPGACLLCAGPAGPDDPLVCPLCQSRWHRLPEPQCPRCGQPCSSVSPECRICPGWPDGFERVRSAVWLEGSSREAVHHLKYGGWWRIADPMARVMAPLLPRRDGGLLVPVPLSRRRQRTRGYNQSERLAAALASVTGIPMMPALLSRCRETGTQTARTPEERRANVAQAFRAGRLSGGARIILIDDVFTTGATLAEAAGALLEAGAGTVESVTFARAKPPLG